MHPILSLLLGLTLAAGGGELFLRSVVGLAQRLRVPAALVALTLAAFATSAPELAVAISAAQAGSPELALGDTLGSNIVNIGLVLGLAYLIGGTTRSDGRLLREVAAATLAPLLTMALLHDGRLGPFDGAAMLATFALWLASILAQARTHRRSSATELQRGKSASWRLIIPLLGLGIVLLAVAGRFIVAGGLGIAQSLGTDPFIVGALVVAVGTSVPELATAIIASLRGHHDVGLGTVIGSNVFNSLFIVPTAAIIHPIAVPWREAAPGLGAGAAIVLVAWIAAARPGRWQGALLLTCYLTYVIVTGWLSPTTSMATF
jgi:cation:H+ antiporter